MTRWMTAAIAAGTLSLGIALGAAVVTVARADAGPAAQVCDTSHMAQMGSGMMGSGMMGSGMMGPGLHQQHHGARP